MPDESLHQIQAWSISFLLYSAVQRLYRKYNAMEIWKQAYKDTERVRTVEQENAEDLQDDMRKIEEEYRQAYQISRQAKILSVAALILSVIALVIRIVTGNGKAITEGVQVIWQNINLIIV